MAVSTLDDLAFDVVAAQFQEAVEDLQQAEDAALFSALDASTPNPTTLRIQESLRLVDELLCESERLIGGRNRAKLLKIKEYFGGE